MKWKIIDTGRASPEKNMAIDAALLKDMETINQPVLHLYDWEGDCATYGHFLDPYNFLNKDEVKKLGLKLARRPTGGGIVFHLTDFAFSVLIPATHPNYTLNTMENYAYVHRIIADALREFVGRDQTLSLLSTEPSGFPPEATGFCMAKPTQFDVMCEEKKLAGGAQRRTKHGFLHQGTLSISALPEEGLKDLLKESVVLPLIKNTSYHFSPEQDSTEKLLHTRKKLREMLLKEIQTLV